MLRRTLILAAMIAGVAPSVLAAQVEPGSRVRIVAGSAEWVGRVAEVHGSTVVLEGVVNGWGIPLRSREVDLMLARRVDVSVRRRSRAEGALRGTVLVGASSAASGALTWAGLNALSGCDPRAPDAEERFMCYSTGDALTLGAIVGLYFGAPAGAVLGFLAPGDDWARVSVPVRPRVVIAPGGRLGVGASLSF